MPRQYAPERKSPWRIAGAEAALCRLATIPDRCRGWPLAGAAVTPVREPGVSGEPGIRECRSGPLRRRYQWRGPSQKRKEPLPVLPPTTQSTQGCIEQPRFGDSAAGLSEMFDRPRQDGLAAGRSRPDKRVPDRCEAATRRLVKSASRLLQAATARLRSIQEEFQRPQTVG